MAGTIVVVPGTSGSELYTPPTLFGLGPRLWVWLDYPVLLGGGWRYLGLQPDGVTPITPLTGPLEPGPPLRSYYGLLCGRLSRLGWGIVAAYLDWRQSLGFDRDRLVSLIRSVYDGTPLHIVAHSRGGLVVRAALGILDAAGQLGMVGRVVGLGVPHQGSWAAAALLAGWDALARSLRHLIYGIEVNLERVGIATDLQAVITSWPTAYALLPAPFAEGVPRDQLATIYNASLWAEAGLPISAAWLAAAQSAWPNLPLAPAAVSWLDVVGVGLLTADQLRVDRPPRSRAEMTWTNQGDGTVLRRWATQPGRPTLFTPTRHSALPYDGRVIAAIDTYLRGGLSQGGVIEGRVLE